MLVLEEKGVVVMMWCTLFGMSEVYRMVSSSVKQSLDQGWDSKPIKWFA